MTAVSELRATITAQGLSGPTTIRCTDLHLVMDKAWSPYIQAEFVVPYTAELEALLNPHNTINGERPRVVIELARYWFDGQSVADTSAEWASGTVADVTAEWASGTVADVTAEWGTEWEAGWKAPDVLLADLTVRARFVDFGEGTMIVRAASDELLAQDARTQVNRPAETIQTRILAVLEAAGVPVVDVHQFGGLYYVTTEATTVSWSQGVYDMLEALAVGQGYHLFCDEHRTWQALQADAVLGDTVTVSRVEEATDDVDLDGEYANAVVVTLSGTDTAGNPLTQTHVRPDPIPPSSVVAVITIDFGQAPGSILPSGDSLEYMLAGLLSKRQMAGRERTFTAVADPTMRPRMAVSLEVPGAPVFLGLASRVEWTLPGDTMTITVRN